jgi:hypothetical protein
MAVCARLQLAKQNLSRRLQILKPMQLLQIYLCLIGFSYLLYLLKIHCFRDVAKNYIKVAKAFRCRVAERKKKGKVG